MPQNLQQSRAMLAAHSTTLLQDRLMLLSQLELAGPDGDALTAAASHQIQFAISECQVTDERERTVWFRDLDELTDGDVVLVHEVSGLDGWTGFGSVDSFVTSSAAQTAVRDLKKLINQMVGRAWL